MAQEIPKAVLLTKSWPFSFKVLFYFKSFVITSYNYPTTGVCYLLRAAELFLLGPLLWFWRFCYAFYIYLTGFCFSDWLFACNLLPGPWYAFGSSLVLFYGVYWLLVIIFGLFLHLYGSSPIFSFTVSIFSHRHPLAQKF